MSLARQLEEALGDAFEQKAEKLQAKAEKALAAVGLTPKDLGPYVLSAAQIGIRARELAGRYDERKIAAAIQSYFDQKGKAERMKSRAAKSRLGEYGRTTTERGR